MILMQINNGSNFDRAVPRHKMAGRSRGSTCTRL